MSDIGTDSSFDESTDALLPSSPLAKETRKLQYCKCKRLARKNCSQQACVQCCTDRQCEGHREHRLKETIIQGKHPIQILAKKKRALEVGPNAFREKAFKYLGETVSIWNFEEYMSNPKWRDEAIRKSKRNVLMTVGSTKSVSEIKLSKDASVGEGRKKKFHKVIEKLYKDSLENETND